jgi:hypothetical protein
MHLRQCWQIQFALRSTKCSRSPAKDRNNYSINERVTKIPFQIQRWVLGCFSRTALEFGGKSFQTVEEGDAVNLIIHGEEVDFVPAQDWSRLLPLHPKR